VPSVTSARRKFVGEPCGARFVLDKQVETMREMGRMMGTHAREREGAGAIAVALTMEMHLGD